MQQRQDLVPALTQSRPAGHRKQRGSGGVGAVGKVTCETQARFEDAWCTCRPCAVTASHGSTSAQALYLAHKAPPIALFAEQQHILGLQLCEATRWEGAGEQSQRHGCQQRWRTAAVAHIQAKKSMQRSLQHARLSCMKYTLTSPCKMLHEWRYSSPRAMSRRHSMIAGMSRAGGSPVVNSPLAKALAREPLSANSETAERTTGWARMHQTIPAGHWQTRTNWSAPTCTHRATFRKSCMRKVEEFRSRPGITAVLLQC